MKTKLALSMLALGHVITFSSALADDSSIYQQVTQPAYGLWSLAASHKISPYHSVDNQLKTSALIFGGYGPIFIEANRFGYNFYRDGTYFSSLIGNFRNHLSLSKEEIDSSSTLSRYRLTRRKAALETGIQLGRRFDNGWVGRIAFLQDISGIHQGQEVDLTLYRRDHFKPFDFGPVKDLGQIRLLSTIGIQLQNEKLNDYYFGVNESELSNNNQKSYQADAGWSAELEFIATYDFSWQDYGPKDWAWYAGLRHYQYSDTMTKSPIVDSALVQQYFIGLGHYF